MKFVGSLHFMAFGTFVEHLTTREKIANIPTAALLLTKPEIKFSEIAWNAWETLRILRMEVFSAVELDVFRVFTKFNTDVKWNCAEHTWNAVYFSIFFFWFIQFRYHSSTLPIFSSFCLDLLFSRCGYDKAKHIIHKIFLCDSHADDCWIFDRNPNQKKNITNYSQRFGVLLCCCSTFFSFQCKIYHSKFSQQNYLLLLCCNKTSYYIIIIATRHL